MSALPNFIYIGTSKAGSTWLFKALSRHPDIYLAPAKGLYFFCEHYHYGLDWYRSQFHPAPDQPVIGEISHSYLFSAAACERMKQIVPDAKLLVCVREPVERTFSQYLDGIKNGKLQGSLEEELERTPSLIERSSYAKYLRRYIEAFGRERIHVALFDELGKDPCGFTEKIFRFLDLEPIPLPAGLQQKILPAGTPRSRGLAYLAKRASKTVKRLGFVKLRGKAKTSRLFRHLLYQPYSANSRPTMAAETRDQLRARFAPEVRELDELLGTNYAGTWGYGSAHDVSSSLEPATTVSV